MELPLMQALWVLGFLPAGDLPQEVGIKALEAGMDTEALRILASLSPMETLEAKEIFEKVLTEFSLPKLSRVAATRIDAKAISKQVVDGQLSPSEGAHKLWTASVQVNDPDFHDLDPFIYAASEFDSRPEDAAFFNREIMREASEWIKSLEKLR
jgi:hypothetical protein